MGEAGVGDGSKMSRRTFLKLGLAAATVALTPRFFRETKEALPLEPSSLSLDFFGNKSDWDKVIAENFPPGFSEEETFREMGISEPNTREGLTNGVPTTDDQIKLFMLKALRLQYQGHGQQVAAIEDQTACLFGWKHRSPNPVSVVPAFRMGRVGRDELGNVSLSWGLSGEVVDQLVSVSSDKVVGLSLELGQFEFSYRHTSVRPAPFALETSTVADSERYFVRYPDKKSQEVSLEEYQELEKEFDSWRQEKNIQLSPEERTVLFQDGYAGVRTYDNLKEMAVLANNHPEKFFVAAAGNPTSLGRPDITQAKAQLAEEGVWADNLIMVGVGKREHKKDFLDREVVDDTLYAFGADIYVEAGNLDRYQSEAGEELGAGSSWARPVVTSVVRRIIEKGATSPSQIRAGLQSVSSPFGQNGEESQLDFEKVMTSLK